MKASEPLVIRRDEAYSKGAVMERLGISQKFWDKMLNDGVPFATIGKARWITGDALYRYFEQVAEVKQLAC